MNDVIISKLVEIERSHAVTILYAIEAGSRSQGVSNSNSDYDVRFIYMHEKDWYLSLDQKKDTIEVQEDRLDISGWDLAKTLRLLRKSNISLSEWLQSKIVYQEVPGFAQELLQLFKASFNAKSAFYHHLQLAKKNYLAYKHKQKNPKIYYYSLKSILACNWIHQRKQMPPNDMMQLLEDVEISAELLTEVNLLLKEKISGKKQEHELNTLRGFMDAELEQLQSIGQDMSISITNEREITLALDNFFRKMLNRYE
ncbi:nucleotidyltransferase domain-containing protein [Niallia circulans]|nr:nucleotidyltransferase domain-containing protein [Niallia circulans]